MNIYENIRQPRENPSNQISEKTAIEVCVTDVKSQYLSFLKSREKQRILFKADFVDGILPLSLLIPTPEELSHINYENLRLRLDSIFEENRIKNEEGISKNFDKHLEKIPPKLTPKLVNYRRATGDKNADVSLTYEILQGKGNPRHILVIEAYNDPTQEFSKFPLAEIWTVNKFEGIKIPVMNADKTIAIYNSVPETFLRRLR